MTLPDFLATHRPRIAAALRDATSFSAFYPGTPWSKDVEKRYRSMEGGKMMRGALTVLGYLAAGGKKTEVAYDLAGTTELLHASLLVHDDVIDQDLMRRGVPSLYAQYSQLGGKPDAVHAGASLAICAGDVGLLHANRRLVQLAAQGIDAAHAADYVLQMVTYTGFGEMDDVALGSDIGTVTEKGITRMLIDKTARYSCAMPLVSGAMLGGAPASLTDALEQLGEDIGLIFQIRDDELGLYGDAKELGKPVGSDVKEGKKTLYSFHLMRAASPAEQKKLRGIYGNPKMKTADLKYVRDLTEAYGIREKVGRIVEKRETRAKETVSLLDAKPAYRTLLNEVLTFVSQRKS